MNYNYTNGYQNESVKQQLRDLVKEIEKKSGEVLVSNCKKRRDVLREQIAELSEKRMKLVSNK